mmetsp:Transcript_41589/g.114616  ORF Transcript_41589/g.114616 Transcript_41589/m.114616 type:complete len:318 (-) Transcript_41589:65-1018(-)
MGSKCCTDRKGQPRAENKNDASTTKRFSSSADDDLRANVARGVPELRISGASAKTPTGVGSGGLQARRTNVFPGPRAISEEQGFLKNAPELYVPTAALNEEASVVVAKNKDKPRSTRVNPAASTEGQATTRSEAVHCGNQARAETEPTRSVPVPAGVTAKSDEIESIAASSMEAARLRASKQETDSFSSPVAADSGKGLDIQRTSETPTDPSASAPTFVCAAAMNGSPTGRGRLAQPHNGVIERSVPGSAPKESEPIAAALREIEPATRVGVVADSVAVTGDQAATRIQALHRGRGGRVEAQRIRCERVNTSNFLDG